jgi:fatty-acid desaturase
MGIIKAETCRDSYLKGDWFYFPQGIMQLFLHSEGLHLCGTTVFSTCRPGNWSAVTLLMTHVTIVSVTVYLHRYPRTGP